MLLHSIILLLLVLLLYYVFSSLCLYALNSPETKQHNRSCYSKPKTAHDETMDEEPHQLSPFL